MATQGKLSCLLLHRMEHPYLHMRSNLLLQIGRELHDGDGLLTQIFEQGKSG